MKKQLKSIAYHEAAHAVLSYILHRSFTYVSIIPEQWYKGCVKTTELKNFYPDCETDIRTTYMIEREVMINLAGITAERFLTGRVSKGGYNSPDIHESLDMLGGICGSSKEESCYINLLLVRTEQILSNPMWWFCVRDLANESLKRRRIGYRLARKIISDAIEKHRDFDDKTIKKFRPPYLPRYIRENIKLSTCH